MTKKVRITLAALLLLLPLVLLLSSCEHEHGSFTDEKTVLAPTCTEDGTGTHVCGDCGETVEFVIPSLGHTEVIDAGVDYTCTADGLSEGKHCSVCHEVLVAQVVLPAAHRPTDWQILKPVSCEIDGYRVKTCRLCEERTHGEAIPSLGHLESDFEVVKAPTCLASGTKQTTCLNCYEVMQSVTVAATGHSESDWIVTVKASCEGSGSRHTVCLSCNEELKREKIDSLGHDRTDWVITQEPTCTATGMKHIACTRCDKTFDETAIDAKGHAYSTTVVAPTCTADGYTKHQCARCPDAYNSDIVPKSGHQYTTRDELATCTTAAYRYYTCMRCTESTVGHAYSEKVSESLGHDYEVRTVAAKCKEDGETRKVCTRCNENEPGSIKVLPATGHTYTRAEVTKDMGNSTVRTATVHTCASCGEKHVSKIVFTYSKSPSKRVNANKGYCYGMTVDYSDLTSATVQTFRVNPAFAYDTDELLGIDVHTHFYITATGELDNSIGIFDKTSAISSSFGYIEADNPSKTWGGYVDIAPDKVSEKKCVYFAFMNYNYTGAFIVKSLSATATFEFGEPVA